MRCCSDLAAGGPLMQQKILQIEDIRSWCRSEKLSELMDQDRRPSDRHLPVPKTHWRYQCAADWDSKTRPPRHPSHLRPAFALLQQPADHTRRKYLTHHIVEMPTVNGREASTQRSVKSMHLTDRLSFDVRCGYQFTARPIRSRQSAYRLRTRKEGSETIAEVQIKTSKLTLKPASGTRQTSKVARWRSEAKRKTLTRENEALNSRRMHCSTKLLQQSFDNRTVREQSLKLFTNETRATSSITH